jgi:hypothetical protein
MSTIEMIVRAWVEPGPHPEVHRFQQQRLRDEWPSLARAVELLVAEEAGR